ncbi:MAG: carboxymuconolactone decarboxylase family protein [Planctomycetota bacterium]
MARLNSVDPATATGETREIFDGPLKGKHINLFKAMGNSPAVLNAYLGMAGALGKASLSSAELELVQLAIGQANSCDYCIAAHTVLGKGAGLSVEETIGARAGTLSDGKRGAIVRFAKALHEKRGFVGDEDIAAFRDAGYDDGAIGEVVAAYALATFTNYFNHVNGTEVDFPAAPALEGQPA